jgi:23S rRNA G2445 N2-methylase RlmL
VDRVLSNPPFGKQLETPEAVGPLYRAMVPEYDRVLRPGGWAVLLTSEARLLNDAARAAGWKSLRQVKLRILGQLAVASVWRKPD